MLVFSLLLIFPATARSQDAAGTDAGQPAAQRDDGRQRRVRGRNTQEVANPFDAPAGHSGMGMMGMMMEMGGEMDDMGMEMGMEMMMAGDDYGMGAPPSAAQRFRNGLQRAIKALKNAKSEKEREKLRGFVREALAERYDSMLKGRKRDLDRLKKRLSALEGDLKRRASAKDRVVQLQMQSVQLAAEGLLELGSMPGGYGTMEAGGDEMSGPSGASDNYEPFGGGSGGGGDGSGGADDPFGSGGDDDPFGS